MGEGGRGALQLSQTSTLLYTNQHILEDSVTTVPLSVCYRALNLLVRVDASNFVPYACDQAVAGEYEGPESTVPSSAISGVSVAAEQSYRTSETLVPVFPFLGTPSTGGPMLALFPFFL